MVDYGLDPPTRLRHGRLWARPNNADARPTSGWPTLGSTHQLGCDLVDSGLDPPTRLTPCGQVPQQAKLVRHACSLARFGRQACTNAALKATTPLGSNAASGGHAQTDVRRHSLHSSGWRETGRRNGAAAFVAFMAGFVQESVRPPASFPLIYNGCIKLSGKMYRVIRVTTHIPCTIHGYPHQW